MSGPPPGRGFNHHGVDRGGDRRGRGRGGKGSRGRGTFAQHRQPRDSGYTPRQHRQDNPHSPDVLSQSSPHGSLCCDHVDEVPASSSAHPSSAPSRCAFRTSSPLALMLHRADRHLIYPEGGIAELKRHDPMLIAEQREQQRRMRQQQRRAPHPLPSRPGTNQTSNKRSRDQSGESSDDSNDEDSNQDISNDGSQSSSDDDVDETASSAPKDDARMLDGPADATISGLNIQLDTPELIAEWVNQRKKRWPTQQVVQQKLREKHERQQRSEMIYGPRPAHHGKRLRDGGAAESFASSSAQQDKRPKIEVPSGLTEADIPDREAQHASNVDGDDNEDKSDSDDAPEEVTSKAPVAGLEEETAASATPDVSSSGQDTRQDRRPICTHFLQGRCNYGDRCKKRHETAGAQASSTWTQQPSQPQRPVRRPHPRRPPVNPFEQPDLLRELLRTEIEKHVDAVGQAIRFIVDNDMLLHVETEEGQAEEQRRQRQKIQVVSSGVDGAIDSQEAKASSDLGGEPGLEEPLVEGAMAVLKRASEGEAGASLYRASSPTLRALSDLKYPPEPDPLVLLDPLRRDDPKPLMPSQLVRIAKDRIIRSIVTPASALEPHGRKHGSLQRALVSLDALPTDVYRNAAIEMMLGISTVCASSSSSAGGGLVVTSKDGRRKVSETDLFRLGLRVGGDEVVAIKKLADRLSVLLDSSLQAGPRGVLPC